MASYFGKHIHVSVFGQSHAPAIGVTVDGLPAGEAVDLEELQRFLQRRAPGRDATSTPRKEGDLPQILCGLVDGVTCGAPLAAVIENTNTRSKDYDELRDTPRPAHADFTAQVKYGGHQDVRGGGHFSGRLTAPLCIAGGIALQILARQGIRIGAHIRSIANVEDRPFHPLGEPLEVLERVKRAPSRCWRSRPGNTYAPPSSRPGRRGTRWAAWWSASPRGCRWGWEAPCSRGWRASSPPPCSPSPP